MVTTNWTGSNGAAWPSPWITVNGTNTIQSNRGQQVTASGSWVSSTARAAVSMTDAIVIVTVNPQQLANTNQRILVRYNTSTGANYQINLDFVSGGMAIVKETASTWTPLSERYDRPWTAGTDYKVRFEVTGTTLRARRWLASASEPSTWDLSTTDSAYTTGDVCLQTFTTDAGGSTTGRWDDFSVTAATTAYTASPADSIGITDSVSAVISKLAVDSVGITDSVTAIRQKNATATPDAVGITDSVSFVHNHLRTAAPADPVGIVDSVQATLLRVPSAAQVSQNRSTRNITHTAFLYDRGGEHQIGLLTPLSRIKWERRRDDVSSAMVYIATPSKETAEMLSMIRAGRVELVIFRGLKRVWEGPVVRVAYKGGSVEIEAHDVMHYVVRTIMRNEYDDRYPNNGTVLERIQRILNAELSRKEALNPPINVLEHIRYITAPPGQSDAGTASHTLPYEMTAFQHIDAFAARGGIDYVVVGRSILFFDVHTPIGRLPAITGNDFIGDPIITEYGMELGTYVAMTDGRGQFGAAGGTDPFYGEWELLFQAYDERTDQDGAPPSVAELTSQAVRSHNQSKLPPVVLRIPDNTSINPDGVLRVEDLVPGVHIPMSAELPGRKLSQMQKLDSMSVEEIGGKGEQIKVTLSPALLDSDVEEE